MLQITIQDKDYWNAGARFDGLFLRVIYLKIIIEVGLTCAFNLLFLVEEEYCFISTQCVPASVLFVCEGSKKSCLVNHIKEALRVAGTVKLKREKGYITH